MPDTIIHKKSIISSTEDGTRILKWILKHYRDIVLSKGNARQSYKRGEITVNGEIPEEARMLRTDDIVEMKYNKTIEALEKIKNVPVDIFYIDQHMAIVWKPPGQNYFIFVKAVNYIFAREHPSDIVWLLYSLQKAASGFIIVARTQLGKQYLLDKYNNGKIKLEMNIICHGQAPPSLETIDSSTKKNTTLLITKNDDDHTNRKKKKKNNDSDDDDGEEEEDDDDYMNEEDMMTSTFNLTSKDLFTSYQVKQVTRSNNADYLSTITLGLKTPWASSSIRRYFYHHGHTIVGNSSGTRPLKTHKDKGLYMSLLSVKMDKLIINNNQQINNNSNSNKNNNKENDDDSHCIYVEQKEPEKFHLIREREQKFWQRSIDKRLKEMKQAGLDDHPMDIIENYGKEPLPYILGEKEFCGLRFEINKSCLIPRKSSETLVNASIPWLLQLSSSSSSPVRILDMGTGCGNLLLSILHKVPNSIGIGVDISEEALKMAKKNQQQLLLLPQEQNLNNNHKWICKDMAAIDLKQDLDNEPVDLMICNPPYLSIEKIEKYHATIKNQPSQQQVSLSYEPSKAIYADHDGYSWYMILNQLAPQLVKYPHGRVILETGKGMIDRILLIWEGWNVVNTIKDNQGWDRCVILERQK